MGALNGSDFERPMAELVSTHVEGLDEVLGGGIPQGSVVLLAGTPGTMKTSLTYTILSHNANWGKSGLFLSLEEPAESLQAAMTNLGVPEPTNGRVYVIDLGILRQGFNVREQSQDWLGIVLRLIRQGIRGHPYKLLAIDSLEALYALADMQNPRRELYHFFTSLKELGLTTIITAEAPFGSDVLTRHGEDFLADGILYLRHVDLGDRAVQLRLRVVKMRMMKHLQGWFTMTHNGERFTIVPALVTP